MLVVVKGEGGDKPDLTISPAPDTKHVKVTKLLTVDTPKTTQSLLPDSVKKVKNRTVFVYDFGFKQHKHTPIDVTYTINDKTHHFTVPSLEEPLNMTAVSCNGFHDPAEKAHLGDTPEFHMWDRMLREHKKHHFHLVLQGGDQVYADPVFQIEDFVHKQIGRAGDMKCIELAMEEVLKKKVMDFYMDLYVKSWRGPHISEALASIPSVMMWDDHDIFDGWGSYNEELLTCGPYQTIFSIAEQFFCAFQLGCTPDNLPPATLPGKHKGKTQVHVLGRTAILSLDLRTERTLNQVMHPDTYTALNAWLSEKRTLDHIFVMSSIPMIYNDFSAIEKLLVGSNQELEDDLVDHWRSEKHNPERLTFFSDLLEFAKNNNTRVTLISGDVHIGAVGCLVDKRRVNDSNTAVINSLITSAVVNLPPPPIALNLLEFNALHKEDVNGDLEAGLVRFPPDYAQTYIPNRNFLMLLGLENHGVKAKWISEGESHDKNFEMFIQPPATNTRPENQFKHVLAKSNFLDNLLNGQIFRKGMFH